MTFKDLTLDTDKKICLIENKLVDLTKHEFLLLQFFLEHKNKIFSRKELLAPVWGTIVSLRTIDVTISRLRKKLEAYGKYIQTRNGFGYGWIE